MDSPEILINIQWSFVSIHDVWSQSVSGKRKRETARNKGDRKFLALSIQFTIQGKIVRPPFFFILLKLLYYFDDVRYYYLYQGFPMKNIYIF